MTQELDWLQILTRCKINIRRSIAPFLADPDSDRPNLGTGAGGDPIRQVDLAAENALVDTLEEHDISFTLISEESGVSKHGGRSGGCYITADPIDGTTNLSRRIPFYATSIAVSEEPVLQSVHSALVADLFHDVTYSAQKGGGAWRNGKHITPSKNNCLKEAVIGVDINSYKVKQISSQLSSLIQLTKHIRHLGANALELCYVADGTTDGFVDIRGKLRTTDMAAAWLIVNEAGARITSPEGASLKANLDPKQTLKFVATSNKEMHRTVLDLIDRERAKC